MSKNAVVSVVAAAVLATSGLLATAPAALAGHSAFHSKISFQFNGCSPFKAVKTARFFGVHKAHIVRVNHKAVVVKGFRNHRPVKVIMANVHGCPIVRL